MTMCTTTPRATAQTALSALLLGLALTAGGTAQAATCTGFTAYANGTTLPEHFSQDGFRFRDAAGGLAPVVVVFSDAIGQPVHGLRADTQGLRVKLPQAASSVEIRAGTFGVPSLTVRAYDRSGQLQRKLVLLPDDGYLNTRVLKARSQPITELRIDGGGDGRALDRICIRP